MIERRIDIGLCGARTMSEYTAQMIEQANKSKSTKRYRKVFVMEILDVERWNEVQNQRVVGLSEKLLDDKPHFISQAVASPTMTKTMVRDIEYLETGETNHCGWGFTEMMLFDVENQEVVWHRKA